MPNLIQRVFSIFIFIAFLVTNAFAYEFKNKDAAYLAELIQHSIENRAFQIEVLTKYAQLSRSEIPVQELLELKFEMQHWRQTMVQTLLRQLPVDDLGKYQTLLFNLNSLGIRLTQDELNRIFENRSHLKLDQRARRLEKRLIGNQGNPNLVFDFLSAKDLIRTGPTEIIKVPALRPSRWTFDWWSSKADQYHYEIKDGVTRYRGVALRSGDFLVSDLATDIATFFASISERETLLPHLSIFVLVEKDGKQLPLVLEMFSPGLRAVPLNSFFSEHFTSYTEIYRLKELSDSNRRRFGEVALSLLQDQFRYNYTNAEDDHLTTCAGLGKIFLKNCGIQPIPGKTSVRPGAIELLKTLGLTFTHYISPSDYAIDPRTQFAGSVDNRLFSFDVSKQLVVHHLSQLADQYRLDMSLMPSSFQTDCKRIQMVQKGGILGNTMLLLGGLNNGWPARSMLYLSHATENVSSKAARIFEFFGRFYRCSLPVAPPETMAAVKNFLDPFSEAVQATQKHLETQLNDKNSFSIHALQEDALMQSTLREAAKEISSWFVEK